MMLAAMLALATAQSAFAQTEFLNTMNIYGVGSNPPAAATFTVSSPVVVNYIQTYHWNNGRGSQAGRVALRASNGQIIGPFNAHSTPGQGGAPNVNWIANSFAATLQPGTYQVLDSDPATWSQNAQSGGRGFAIVRGTTLPTGGIPIGGGRVGGGTVIGGGNPCANLPVARHPRGFNYTNHTSVVSLLTPTVAAGGFIQIQMGCMPTSGDFRVTVRMTGTNALPFRLTNVRVNGTIVTAQIPPYPGWAGRSWEVEVYNFSTNPPSAAVAGVVAVQ
jgi:hypothetical protein